MSRTKRTKMEGNKPIGKGPDGADFKTLDMIIENQNHLRKLPEKPKTRKRRGKIVDIPPEWISRVTYSQTITKRKRRAKAKHKESRKHQRDQLMQEDIVEELYQKQTEEDREAFGFVRDDESS